MASIAPQDRILLNGRAPMAGKGGWPLFGRLLMWAVRNAR